VEEDGTGMVTVGGGGITIPGGGGAGTPIANVAIVGGRTGFTNPGPAIGPDRRPMPGIASPGGGTFDNFGDPISPLVTLGTGA